VAGCQWGLLTCIRAAHQSAQRATRPNVFSHQQSQSVLMKFTIGDVPDHANPKRIRHAEQFREVKNGDVVDVFDHIIMWDDDCVTEDLVQRWRMMGDPLCDEALQTVFQASGSSVGKELLACLEEYAAEHPEDGPVNAFLREVSQHPPAGIEVTGSEADLARELFLDNSIEFIQALLHYSLAGGFASPRITRTLQAVSYLVPQSSKPRQEASSNAASSAASQRITGASNERTFIRLLETFQMVLDVLDCTAMAPHTSRRNSHSFTDSKESDPRTTYLEPGGYAWRSTVNVRLLHGIARMRVRERWRREGREDFMGAAVPINQEELSGTLAAFSTIPIWCLHRLHVHPSAEHVRAYLALWRHVGFYLGIYPSIIRRHFSSPITADKFIVTTAMHLFSTDDPSDAADAPTIPILRAVSNRAPMYNSLEYNCALTRHILGPSLSDRVGLPRTPLFMSIRMHTALLLQRIPHWVTHYYPRKGWTVKRRAVLKEGVARSVRWNLGMRRVSFRPRTDVKIDGSEHRSGEGEGGEIVAGVKEAEAVQPDIPGAHRLIRQWREVLAEMIAVCAGVGVVGVGLSWITVRFLWSLW